ncbi:MAG: TonB-dependent receptor, partial [Bacteroidetes bacterium]
MKTKLTSILCLMLALSGAMPIQAQQQLDSVVVTASRLNVQAGQMGQRVTVLRGEALQRIPATSLDDLLRYLPGIEVQSRGLFGTQADITMRGSTFNQVLVLIDGVRVNDPLTGHFNGYMPVTMAEIDRIEIIHGASSAIYGTEAVGGVIHIITKAFAQSSDKGLDGQAEVQYGQHQTLTGSAGIDWQTDNLRLVAGVQHAQSDGHLPKGDSLPYDFNLTTVAAGLGLQLAPNVRLSLRSALDTRDFNARFFYTRSTYDLSREQVRRWFNQAALRWQHDERHETQLVAGYQTTTDSFLFNPAFPGNHHTTRQLDLKGWHRIEAGEAVRFTLGGQYLGKRIESNDRGNHRTGQFGLFALAHVQPSGKWDLQGGLRLEHESSFGTELVPQLSISYRVLPALRLRGFAGRSIRAADFTERYISTNLPALSPGRNLGNPDLLAERSWNVELGTDAVLGPTLSAHLTGYYRHATNLIDFVLTEGSQIPNATNIDPSGTYFFAQNIAELQTTGLEAELRYRKELSAGALEATAAYRWLDFAQDG